jgi:hypothetical protein
MALEHRASAFGEQVERAIREGVRFLKQQQGSDGSWPEVENRTYTGTTSLVTLALLAAGEKANSPAIHNALEFLRKYQAEPTRFITTEPPRRDSRSKPLPRVELESNKLNSTYAIALQTMVFAAAEPERDQERIAANVGWLERAQIGPRDQVPWPGTWTYGDVKFQSGDHSNTQYALLALSAASEVGLAIKPEIWRLSRDYFERSQNRDGGWAYTRHQRSSTGSMTCAAISSLLITGSKRARGPGERLQGESIQDCGKGQYDPALLQGLGWLATHFRVDENFGGGPRWKFYSLYGLERAGRLSGLRLLGTHDWFREGAEELVHCQDKNSGSWEGASYEKNKLLATALALLFLANGRAPVLIQKLRHLPAADWNNDRDDIRNLVGIVSREWKSLLTWQIVDSRTATVSDLLRAPILFISGHKAPEFTPAETMNLRRYLAQGGVILADACCGSADFEVGFRNLLETLLAGEEHDLRPLADDHPIWRVNHHLAPGSYPLRGIHRGGKLVLVYSPKDLSCYWNQANRDPSHPAVITAVQVGQNVVDHVTGRTRPRDKLSGP